MDKKGIIIVCALFLFILIASGCETTKGVAQGVGTTIDGTAKGVVKDAKGLVSAVSALDNWIKENLW